MQDPVIAADNLRILNGRKGCERPDLHADSGHDMNALNFFNPANVHYVGGAEEPLLHGGNEVGAAGQNLDGASMFGEIANRFLNAAWT